MAQVISKFIGVQHPRTESRDVCQPEIRKLEHLLRQIFRNQKRLLQPPKQHRTPEQNDFPAPRIIVTATFGFWSAIRKASNLSQKIITLWLCVLLRLQLGLELTVGFGAHSVTRFSYQVDSK